MINRDQLSDLVGAQVVDDSRAVIGTVGAVFLDGGGRPAWATVRTGTAGEADAFVPLQDGRLDGDALMVPFEADRVRQAPRPGTHAHPSHEETERLREHYGLPGDDSRQRAPSTLPEPHGSVTGAAYDRPPEALPPSQVERVTRRTGAGADAGLRRLLHRYRPGRRDRSGGPDA
jgi:PRC-barrel domain